MADERQRHRVFTLPEQGVIFQTQPRIEVGLSEFRKLTDLHRRQENYFRTVVFSDQQTAEGHQVAFDDLAEVGGPYDVRKTKPVHAIRRYYTEKGDILGLRIIQFSRANPPIAFPAGEEFMFAGLPMVSAIAWRLRRETIAPVDGGREARVEIPAFGDSEVPKGKIVLHMSPQMLENINISLDAVGGAAN